MRMRRKMLSRCIEEIDLQALGTPSFGMDSTRQEERQMLRFGVTFGYGRFSRVVKGVVFDVAATELIDFLVENLMIHIIYDAFEATIE